jgi:hypothetical protein
MRMERLLFFNALAYRAGIIVLRTALREAGSWGSLRWESAVSNRKSSHTMCRTGGFSVGNL